MILGLNVVCDAYFCEALELMVSEWKVQPDVAGATFMAAGGVRTFDERAHDYLLARVLLSRTPSRPAASAPSSPAASAVPPPSVQPPPPVSLRPHIVCA